MKNNNIKKIILSFFLILILNLNVSALDDITNTAYYNASDLRDFRGIYNATFDGGGIVANGTSFFGGTNKMWYYKDDGYYVRLPATLNKNATEEYSINFWFNTTKTDRRMIFGTQDGDGSLNSTQIQINYGDAGTSDGRICYELRSGGTYSINCDLGSSSIATKTDLNNGTMHMFTFVFNESGTRLNFYYDGVFAGTKSGLTAQAMGNEGWHVGMPRVVAITLGHIGGMDEVGIWKGYALNADDTLLLFNNGTGTFPPFSSPQPESNTTKIIFQGQTPTNNTIQYFYTNNNLTIQTNATFFGGRINTTIYLYNSTGLYTTAFNSTINQTAIFNTTFSNLPIGTYRFNATATNGSITNKTTQITFTIYEIIRPNLNTPNNNQQIDGENLFIAWNTTTTNPNISNTFSYNLSLYNKTNNFQFTINNTGNNSLNPQNYTLTNIYALNLSIGINYLNLTSTDYNNNKISTTQTINITANSNLTIKLYNAYTNANITSNGTINITANGETRIYNITNGTGSFPTIKNQTYTILFNIEGYSLTTTNHTTNTNITYQQANFTLYTNNSVNIFIYDEITNALITANVTIDITGATPSRYNTITGNQFIQDLTDGNHTLTFTALTYAEKNYIITVASRSTQTLNAYLGANQSLSIFNFVDSETATNIQNVTLSQYARINGTFTLTDLLISDITGRVQISYTPLVEYQFLATKTGYESLAWSLDPVLFSSYDIPLVKTITNSPATTPDFLGIAISFYNTTFTNNQSHVFNWIITSPTGSLLSYNLSITYPTAGNIYRSGTNAIGTTYIENFTITGANITEMVQITYCYQTTTSYNKCFKYNYNIIGGSYGNTTFIALKTKNYGLGTLEKTIIATIIILIFAGVTFAFVGANGAVVISLLMMAFMVSTGFLTLWQVLPSMIIGFIYLAWGLK